MGIIMARFWLWVTSHVDDIQVAVILQFCGTFGVWILADHLGLSAIITVVSFAMTTAQSAPGRIDARHRIASYAVWEVARSVCCLGLCDSDCRTLCMGHGVRLYEPLVGITLVDRR